jgi:hypothetical protein
MSRTAPLNAPSASGSASLAPAKMEEPELAASRKLACCVSIARAAESY